MRIHCSLLIIFLLISFHCKGALIDTLAQNNSKRTTLEGVVGDSKSRTAIPQATVRLLAAKDSALISGTISSKDGRFTMPNIAPGKYLLKVSFMGYKTFFKDITVNQRPKLQLSIPQIRLTEDSRMLDEITISAQQPEMVAKQDTIEYSANALGMEQGATVEDILTRVPGMDVDEEGKIQTKGKAVTKILVDGKEMFKGDMTMITKNIPADIIDKIQVITDKTEIAKLTGIDDGVELTVINITIKKGMKKGWIVKAQAAGGGTFDIQSDADLRYKTNLYLNRIQGDDNMMLTYNSDNLGSGSGILGRNTNHSIGLSLASERSKKLKQYGDIRINTSQRSSYSRKYRENYFADSLSYQQDSSQNVNSSKRFSANYNLSYKPNDNHTLNFRPSFSLNSSEADNQSTNYTQAGDSARSLVNYSKQQSSSKGFNYSLSGDLDYSWKMNEKGRRLSASLRFNLNNNESDGTRNSENIFLLMPQRNQLFDQISDNYGKDSHLGASIFYVEPIGNKNYLQASYNIGYGNQENINMSYDYNPFTQQYDSLNPTYSKSFDNRSIDQRLSLSFQSVRERYNYSIGADMNPNYKENFSFIDNAYQDGSDSIIFAYDGITTISYTPRANFSYKFNKNRRLRFDYRGNMNNPSVSQLDPTIDITNPLHIRHGNPDLLPTYTHSPSLSYSNYNEEKLTSLSVDLRGRYVQNDIVNITSFEDKTGVQTTSPQNESGTWNLSASASYNCPIGKKFQINNYTEVGTNNQIGYTVLDRNSVKNISQTLSLNESLSIAYRIKWLRARLRLNANYRNTEYSVAQKKGQQNLNYSIATFWVFKLPADWEISTDLQYRGTQGYSNGYNQESMLWNMRVQKSILPKKLGTISLEARDILRQRTNINRSYTSNYMQDQQRSIQESYFLLSFAINFNSMGGSGR